MVTTTRIVLAMISTFLLAGCGKPQQQSPGQWLETATGVQLSAVGEELHAQAIVVFPVGDTYYLKLETNDDFPGLLQSEFNACSWSDANDYLEPPKNWRDQLPFWDLEAIQESEHFRRDYTNRGNHWMSYVAYNAEDGVCYVVCVQVGG